MWWRTDGFFLLQSGTNSVSPDPGALLLTQADNSHLEVGEDRIQDPVEEDCNIDLEEEEGIGKVGTFVQEETEKGEKKGRTTRSFITREATLGAAIDFDDPTGRACKN